MYKIVGYVRISKRESSSGHGTDAQELKITGWCIKNGYMIDKFFTDKGITGMVLDRPSLNNLLKYLETSDIKTVVVTNAGRLSRSTELFKHLSNKLVAMHVNVISIEEPNYHIGMMPDTVDNSIEETISTVPSDNSVTTDNSRLIEAFHQMDRIRIIDRLASGRRAKLARGEKDTGAICLGYTWNRGKVEVDSKESKVVQYMFKKYIKYKSLNKTADKLNNKGYLTKKGCKFTHSTVKRILTNKFYIGIIVKADGEYNGCHTTFIDTDMFKKVQDILRG